MSRTKSEIIRCLRLGSLRSLLRSRCGHTLPDDDAGREYLCELLLPVSLGAEPELKMANNIETCAEWMSEDETSRLIDQINRTPIYLRKSTARIVGKRLRVTREEWVRLKLKTILPFDMTDDEIAEFRRTKKRARDRRRRRAAGAKSRETYLANSLTRTKPWEPEGISRRTWERRRRANGRDASPRSMKLLNYKRHTCDTEKLERPKEGLTIKSEEEKKQKQKGKTARAIGS